MIYTVVEIKTFEKYYSMTKLFCKDRSKESTQNRHYGQEHLQALRFRWDIFGQREKRKKTGQSGLMREKEPSQRESCKLERKEGQTFRDCVEVFFAKSDWAHAHPYQNNNNYYYFES